MGGASLFYIFEKDNPRLEDNFASIPDSLYMTAVFLGGEWCAIDFTVPGKILCCFFCVIGIGLFSIPIGFLFDAFQDILGGDDDDDDDDDGDEDGDGGDDDAKAGDGDDADQTAKV